MWYDHLFEVFYVKTPKGNCASLVHILRKSNNKARYGGPRERYFGIFTGYVARKVGSFVVFAPGYATHNNAENHCTSRQEATLEAEQYLSEKGFQIAHLPHPISEINRLFPHHHYQSVPGIRNLF